MTDDEQAAPVSDPVSASARAAAQRLAAELEPGIVADVEAALHQRGLVQRPERYFDPISLGGLIVSIATLAWTVYADLRKRTPRPAAEDIARTVRVQLRSTDATAPRQRDRIIEVVVSETLHVASPVSETLHVASSMDPAPRATFYFDLGSPFVYLTAERLHEVVAAPVRWQPVSLGALFKATGRSSWALGDPERRAAGMAEVQRRAQGYGLPPIHWPEPWPGNYLMAMRAATFADRAGRGPALALHALRGAFRDGRDLSIAEHVLGVAEDAGLDPREVREATQDPQIKLALREATEAAQRLGVFGVPTIAAAGELFWGDDRLEDAAARLAQTAAP